MASSLHRYDVGDRPECSVVFTDRNNNPADPSTVTAKVQDPSGTETTPTPIHDGIGRYHIDVDVTLAGIWYWRMNGTGLVQAAFEGSFVVAPTVF